MRGASQIIYFATGNRAKYLEAARIASSFGINLKHLKLAKREIQSNRLSEIASFAAMQATEQCHCPVVCEDAGFFIDALNGFPGPYSSYVYRTLGTAGILKLMKNVKRRDASFSAAVAYCQPGRRPLCFGGTVGGVVSKETRGYRGFGFDPIFIPRGGDGRTFAEMKTNEKNSYSHRGDAFKRFSKWFASGRRQVK